MSSPDATTYDALAALALAVTDDLTGDASAEEAVTEGEKTVWRCTVCGYEYEGDELPADYVCPVCGVGPDKFEKVT